MAEEPISAPIDDLKNRIDAQKNDAVIDFFSQIKFETNLFDIINQSDTNPELYDQLFQAPELFILNNARMVIAHYDPNGKCPEGLKDHEAMLNIIRWIMLKFATDPVYTCYFGYLFRFVAAHTSPGSYWPVQFHPRWLPENFIVRGEQVNVAEENAKIRTPAEIFKRKVKE
jgi:hypothetical protein